MSRPRRRLRRRTWPLRRGLHRLTRPLRRPVGHAASALLLGLAVLGAVAVALTPQRSAIVLAVGETPGRLVVEEGTGAYAAGLRTGDRLRRVAGESVPDSLLDANDEHVVYGTFGETVEVGVERDGEVHTVGMTMEGREIANARRIGLSARAIDRVESGLWYATLLALIGVAVVLYGTSRGRGYPSALARALLIVAAGFGGLSGSGWMSTAVPDAAMLIQPVLFGLAVVAIPALVSALVRFPDGRFLPAWTRHSRWIVVSLLAVVVAGAIVSEMGGGETVGFAIAVGALLGAVTIPLVGLIQKYRRTPAAVVRQQMKWVMLPLAAFLAVLFVDGLRELAVPAFGAAESVPGFVYDAVSEALAGLAALAIPLGVLAGVLGFRPWDADLWIGRSVAVGAATFGLAAAFAAAAEALRVVLRTSMGQGAEAVAAALAAVVAVAVFNPVREWLTRRADADLRRTRERLTERLPLLLSGRQVVAAPSEIGRVAIAAVREVLETDRAAVLDLDPGGWEVVAAEGVEPDAALAWAQGALDPAVMPRCSVQVWEDPVFVLRVPLRSAEDELVGVLALGTHGRGRGYSTEERRVLDGLARPLAEALRVAERREASRARDFERLVRLVERFTEAGDGAVRPAVPDA